MAKEVSMHGQQNIATRTMMLLLPGLLYVVPAASQSERPGESEWQRSLGSPDRVQSAVPRAPVGHRQPTAADVPKDLPKDAADAERVKRDRELDAKLRICRGC
jgi:hypothetical protein